MQHDPLDPLSWGGSQLLLLKLEVEKEAGRSREAQADKPTECRLKALLRLRLHFDKLRVHM